MQRMVRMIKSNKGCYFCEKKILPEYKEVSSLERFLTERGKLVSAMRSGVCAKHQRALNIAVKRARFVALLPFVVKS